MRSELTHTAIRQHYVQLKLRLDLLATLPYDAFAIIGLGWTRDAKAIMFIAIALRLPKLLRCSRLFAHFGAISSQLPPQLQLNAGKARLAIVTFVFLYVWHVWSCVWLLDAYAFPPSHTGLSWISEDLSPAFGDAAWAHTSEWTSYLRAAYFTITTMSTVGYGDVRPQNPLETALSMLLVLLSASLFAVLIGLISSLVRLNDIEEEALKTQLDYLKHYMTHHNLPAPLCKRITGYYRLLWSNPRVSQTQTLETLPPFLRRDLGLWMHRDALLSVSALSELTFFPLTEVRSPTTSLRLHTLRCAPMISNAILTYRSAHHHVGSCAWRCAPSSSSKVTPS